MKRFVLEFLRRGFSASGVGPIVLAIVYLVLQRTVGVSTLTVNEVCIGVFSLFILAFIAGGMNTIYQIERLPLMMAILIHGLVLYVGYLVTYLLNAWLEFGLLPIAIFTGVFVVGYIVIWCAIYCASKRNTERINKRLKENQDKT